MADEYIKRSELLELAREYYTNEQREEAVPVKVIKNIPSASVAPVKHGKWENQSPVFCWNKYGVYQTAYKCSVCGEMTPIDYNICPWCGSRMDGAE